MVHIQSQAMHILMQIYQALTKISVTSSDNFAWAKGSWTIMADQSPVAECTIQKLEKPKESLQLTSCGYSLLHVADLAWPLKRG